jgi:endonuclease-3
MKKKKERRQRLDKMRKVLKKLYPHPQMALRYSSPWEMLVAVMLSAQCTDKKVNEVTEKLFQKYKNLNDYVSADVKEFEEDIKQTGFYRNKAKNILAAARLVKERYDGKLPKTMEEMLELPGVARKTANVVLGNLYGIAEGIAVDTHVRRFVYRFDLSDSTDPKKIEKDLMEITPQKEWIHLTHRFIDYGRDYCPARKHDCINHPLTKIWPPAANRWIKAK